MPDCIAKLPGVVRIKRDGLVFFKGSFMSDLTKQITQVHVFEESKTNNVTEITLLDGQEGYQRPALKSRQTKFAKYLKERTDGETFAPPVVLNARGLWDYEPLEGHEHYGTLCLRGAANIIDGQHRLGGYIAHFEQANEPRSIDFMAYEALKPEKEKWVFFTINTNQKGVPSALSVVIDDTEWQNRVARKIAEDSSSLFMGKVSMAGQPGAQYLWKLNAVATNVARMFKSEGFAETPEESKYDIFLDYWNMIRETHSEAWDDFDRATKDRTHKLLELTGLVAYCRLFDDRFKHHYNATTDTMDWGAVKKDLEELAERLPLGKEEQFKGMTGEYGAGQILGGMRVIFSQPFESSK